MITSLAHYTVRAANLSATRDFYTNVLGLRAGPRPPFGFPGVWLYLGNDFAQAEQGCVHLIGAGEDAARDSYLGSPRHSEGGSTSALDHIAFFATDWKSGQDRLNKFGVGFTERVVPMLGVRQVFLCGPDGITIELNYPA